jgi:hypothetical protein
MIKAVIFSYKNKNLKLVVEELIKNTSNEIFISVLDKHNINRKDLFLNIPTSEKIEYSHIGWDELEGPADYKGQTINESSFEYSLTISDDVVVCKDWDRILIDFLKNKKAIVSGKGELSLNKKNLFFFRQDRSWSENFVKTNFADKNFIFGKTEYLKDSYPTNLKYYGEDEMLSLNLFYKKVEIFSAPSNFYEDFGLRTIENKYTTFSLEHNYNDVIENYINAPAEYLEMHKIDREVLTRLPYDPNDVAYNPYLLDFQHVDASKFITNPKSIF